MTDRDGPEVRLSPAEAEPEAGGGLPPVPHQPVTIPARPALHTADETSPFFAAPAVPPREGRRADES